MQFLRRWVLFALYCRVECWKISQLLTTEMETWIFTWPITWTPANSNCFLFPFWVRITGVPLNQEDNNKSGVSRTADIFKHFVVKFTITECLLEISKIESLVWSTVKGNEMANLGNYQAAVDLFTQAINLDAKDFRLLPL